MKKLEYLKLFEKFKQTLNLINESNFDNIKIDWRENNSDVLDDLRDYSLLDSGLFSFSMNRDSKSKTVTKLKKILDEICSDMDVKDIAYLKLSNYAIIFLCDNMILKFFSNRWSHSIDEYNMVKRFIGKDIPGLVKYYKVWNSESKTYKGNKPGPFYAILMEKCDELSELEKSLFNKFHEILNLDKTSNKITRDEMLEKLKKYSDENKMIDEFVNLFFSLKGIVQLDDFRGDNLGRVDGKLTHFDPMDRSGCY